VNKVFAVMNAYPLIETFAPVLTTCGCFRWRLAWPCRVCRSRHLRRLHSRTYGLSPSVSSLWLFVLTLTLTMTVICHSRRLQRLHFHAYGAVTLTLTLIWLKHSRCRDEYVCQVWFRSTQPFGRL